MNKAHKTIWSEASGTWIAVSENTNARGKPSRSARHLGKSLAAAGLSVAGLFTLTPDAQASTYAPSNCNNASATGPDGIVAAAGTAPKDGTGVWSNVIGCNANGGNYQGVQIMGYNATATGSGAVALGFSATGALRGTGVGMQAQATGAGSTALGQWTRATAPGSIAIGGDTSSNTAAAGAQATGANALAMVGQARAAGDSSVAIGQRAVAARNGDVAIGVDSRADGTTSNLSAVAIGRGSAAVGEDAIALGNSANAQVHYGAAIGNFATVTARNATALGNSAKSGGIAATAIGNFSNASADNAVAIGGGGQLGSFVGAQASGVGAVAIGGNNVRGAAAAAASGIALGGESSVQAGADSGIAIGRGAQVLDAAGYGIAQGDGAIARSQNDIAIGRNASTAADSDGNNIALGNGVVTGSQGHNVAIGSGATTANSSSASGGAVAIGRDQKAIGDGAVALGDPNTANGTGAVALGAQNIAAGDAAGDTAANGSVAIGSNNRAIGQGSVALGNGSTTTEAGSIALGDTAATSAANAIAIGSGSSAANAGDVALGSQSRTAAAVATTAATIDGRTYQFAGTAPASTLSVGDVGAERTITNVAAGRINANSTDAINGSQLFAANQAIEAVSDSAVKYDRNPDDSIDYGSVTLNPGGDPARLGNVAAGDVSADSTDAVNGSQLHETNQQVAQNTGDISQIGDTITNIAGDTSQANTDANGIGIRYARTNEAGLAQSDAFAQGEGSTAVGYNATATADSALALGREAQASHAGSVALGANAVADGSTLGTPAYNPGTASIAGTAPAGEVSLGSAGAERRITNVAAGATDTDAVNVSQLKSVAADVNNLGDRAVRYDGNPGDPKTSISLEGPASTDGGRTGGTTITNVARGDVSENSTDAVNGSQLHETNQQVAQNAGDISQIGDTITNIAGDTSQANTDANGVGIRYARTNEAGLAQSDAFAQGQGSTAVGYNATATADSALALGREAHANVEGSVALGANAVADGSTLGTAAYNPGTAAIAGTAPAGEVSLGSAGAERRITNVAAGATDTDAVNVSQLKSVAADVSNLGDRAVRYDGNPGDPKTSISLEGPASTDGGRTGGTTITNVARGDVSENSTDAVNGSQLHETNQQVAQNAGDISQIGDTITNIAGDTSQANTDANGVGIRYARTNEAGLAQSDAFAQGQGSTAVGYNATATADSALALGREAQASHAGSVALGANAVADGSTLGTAAYNPGTAAIAGTAPAGEVSLGSAGAERRITNVAAGATDTDAVNVSQLKSVAADVSNLGDRAVRYDGNPGDPKTSISLEGPASTDGGRTGGTTITNVARGDVSENSTDAVNGSQLHETNQQVAQNTGDISQIGDTITNIAGDTSQANTDANGIGIRYARTNEAGLAQSDAFAQGQGSTAVGYGATAAAESALALGREAHANVEGSVALGAGAVSNRALTPDSGSIAAGSGGALVPFNTTDRTLLGAVSVGSDSTYRQITNVADGTNDHDAVTVRQLTGAITSVTVTGTRYFHANSTQEDSLAAGTDSIAIGPNTVVNGSDGIGMGNGAVVEQNAPGGIAFGEQARSRLADGIAIGTQALADAEQGVALGAGSRVSVGGGVALGAGSIADTAAGAAGYVPAGANGSGIEATRSKLAAVSVGDVAAGEYRQITGVAAGTVDSDAVNVSQLKALASNVSDLDSGAVKYDRNPDGSVNYGSVTLNPGGDPARLGNVAAGDVSADSTDAVNGSQLHETNQQVAQNAGDISQIGDTITNIAGDTSQANTDANGLGIRYARTNEAGLAQSDAFAQGQGSTAVGYNATATADSALALGREAQASHAGSVALGANAVADGSTLGTAAYNPGTAAIAGTAPAGEVSLGSAGAERRITNVAAGATDTDAVNVSQLKAVATDVSNISDRAVRYDGDAGDPKTSISLEGPASTDGGRTGGTRISNVARGNVSENSTDAVNGSQLHETNQQVAQNAGDISQIGDTITNIAGDTSQANTDANGLGIRYARTNEAGLAQSDAFAQGQGSTAVGYNATATADSALALGREAQASHAGSVALGANAVADGTTLGTAAYNPNAGVIAGTAPVGEVSVGSAGAERRITNVAAGATDTDAVNVSQLKAVDGKFQDLIDTDTGIKYFHANSQAADSRALGAESIAIGPRALADAEQAIALGDAATAAGAGAIALGSESEVRGARAVSLGSGNNVSGAGAFALGNDNTVAAANAFVLGSNVSILDGGLSGAVVLGNGSTVTAASATAGGTINGTEYLYAGGNPAAGDVLSIGSASAPRQIQNVAAGRIAADSTDAVNGSQLYATNQAVDSLGMTVNNIANGGAGVKYFHANGGASAVLPDSQANGLGSVAAGPAAVASGANSVAMGNGAVANKDGDVALGAGSVADRGAESYTGKYSGAQNDTAGTVSVGAPGAERTISNVADGRNATDAVNVRQLEGAVKEANEYTDKRITEVAGSVVEVGDKIDKIDNRVTAVEGDVSSIKNGADGMFQVSQGDTPPPAPKASGSNSTAGGAGAVASGKDSTAIGNGAQATGAGATAVGQGSKASGSNSVALGAGSEAARDNSVSVGSEGSERQIINVARGTSGTDAVNVNQLREVETGLSNQVAGVRRDLQQLDNRLSAGIAGAMAMSGLPQAYLPGKSMFSMGGATWRGESGFAMGLSTVSENGKWVVKGLANSTSRGDVGAAVGVGYQW